MGSTRGMFVVPAQGGRDRRIPGPNLIGELQVTEKLQTVNAVHDCIAVVDSPFTATEVLEAIPEKCLPCFESEVSLPNVHLNA